MRPLSRRVLIVLLELVAAFVLLLTLGIGGLVWQLNRGPVQADFALEYIEPFINPPGADIRFEVGSVTFELADDHRELVVTTVDVLALTGDTGREIFSIPAIEARYNFGHLIKAGYQEGLAAFREKGLTPRLLVMKGPRIRLIRTEGGPVRIAAPVSKDSLKEPSASEDAQVNVAILDRLLSGGGASTGLEGLAIDGATIVLDNETTKVRWIGTNANIRLRRADAGISMSGEMELLVGLDAVEIKGDALWIKANQRIDVDLEAGRIRPPALADKVEALSMLRTLDVPLTGRVQAQFSQDLSPLKVGVSLGLEPGGIAVPQFFDTPIGVVGGEIAADWEAGAGALISVNALDLEGPLLDATITLDPIDQASGDDPVRYAVDMSAVATSLPVNDLPRFWPESMSPNARAWVADSLSTGMINTADVSITGEVNARTSEFALTSLAGEGTFENASLIYIEEMPHIHAVDGTVAYTDVDVRINTRGGDVEGLDLFVQEGDITLIDLETDLPKALINTVVVGSARDALILIDKEPLGFPSELGLDPNDASGQVAVRTALDLPLLIDLELEDIGVGTAANLVNASVAGMPFGEGIKDATLSLSLDGRGMTVAGDAILSGSPVTFEWQESFSDITARKVDGTVTVTGGLLADLGFEIAPYAAGAAETVFRFREEGNDISRIDLDADLTNMQLRLDSMLWEKRPGNAGRLQTTVFMKGDTPERLENLAVTAPGLTLEGRIDMAEGAPAFVTLDRLDINETALTMRADLTVKPRKITVRGRQIDASALMESEKTADAEKAAAAGETTKSALSPEVALDLDLAVEKVLLSEGRVLDGVSAQLVHNGTRWQRISAEGRPGGRGRLSFEAIPLEVGHSFLLSATDAGAALRWLDLLSSLEGGALTIDGWIDLDDPSHNMEARLRVDRFRLVRAPAALQVLRLVSLTGLFEALSADGIPFARFDANLEKQSDQIRVLDGRGVGNSLGFQVDGQIRDKDDQLDLSGLLVPAYTLNAVIGSVPLVGPLLTGGDGGGVIATRFYVNGTPEEPTVSVDPLQSLAPGFLRNIFGYFIDGGGAQDRQISLQSEDESINDGNNR